MHLPGRLHPSWGVPTVAELPLEALIHLVHMLLQQMANVNAEQADDDDDVDDSDDDLPHEVEAEEDDEGDVEVEAEPELLIDEDDAEAEVESVDDSVVEEPAEAGGGASNA